MLHSRIIIAMVVFLAWACATTGYASEYPNIQFTIKGKIVDWDTKEPIKDVTIIAFLNDHIYSDNNGWSGENDWPNFPRTNENGEFEAKTRLYRGDPEIIIKKLELIAFSPRYRTERFIFDNPQFELPQKSYSGLIKISEFSLLKTRIKSEFEDYGHGDTKIFSFNVIGESTDELTLDVEYFYSKKDGSKATVGVITLLDGKSTGNWAYKAILLQPGHNTARISLGMSQESSEKYHSNSIEIFIYSDNGYLAKKGFPFKKDWVKKTDR